MEDGRRLIMRWQYGGLPSVVAQFLLVIVCERPNLIERSNLKFGSLVYVGIRGLYIPQVDTWNSKQAAYTRGLSWLAHDLSDVTVLLPSQKGICFIFFLSPLLSYSGLINERFNLQLKIDAIIGVHFFVNRW